MKIKKNDTVAVLAGKDRGKTGKVLRAFPQEGKIVVEGVHIVAKHIKARKNGEKGQKLYMPKPLPVDKVMLVCPHCNAKTRVGYSVTVVDGKKKKERMCKKGNHAIS